MIDFPKFCRDYHIPFIESGHHHCHQGWLQVNCPFCTSGNHGWHLGFHLEGGSFNCWRCGSHSPGRVIEAFLKSRPGQKVYDVLQKYQSKGHREKRQPTARKKAIAPPTGIGPLAPAHTKYLRRRGFRTRQLVKDWHLQGTTYLSGSWCWRIIIPIYNAEGVIVAYQGRAIRDEARPKYRLTEEQDILEDPKSLLYGIHRVPDRSIVVVEGATGVWRLGPGAVATLGIDWQQKQANTLRRYEQRYILFDPDERAQRRAVELANWLSLFPGTTEILTGFRTDPGDFSNRQARRIMRTLGIER